MIFKDPKYIYGIELNADGLSVKNFDNVFKLAGEGAFFGPYIYKRKNIIIYLPQLVFVTKFRIIHVKLLWDVLIILKVHIYQKMKVQC